MTDPPPLYRQTRDVETGVERQAAFSNIQHAWEKNEKPAQPAPAIFYGAPSPSASRASASAADA